MGGILSNILNWSFMRLKLLLLLLTAYIIIVDSIVCRFISFNVVKIVQFICLLETNVYGVNGVCTMLSSSL